MAIKASAAITLSSIRDLQSCTRYYLLQSSTSAKPAKPTAKPPGGSWVTAEPSYTTGSTNSLYFCDLNVFSDGTFAYSEVSLSSSYEAAKAAYNEALAAGSAAAVAQQSVDSLEIGGRNLALGSRKLETASAKTNRYVSCRGNAVRNERADGFTEAVCDTSWQGLSTYANAQGFAVGDVLTLSAMMCSNAGFNISFYLMCMDSAGTRVYPNDVVIDGQTQTLPSRNLTNDFSTDIAAVDPPRRVYCTFVWSQGLQDVLAASGTVEITFQVHSIASGGTVRLYAPKLERGNRATDWSPAPEDVNSAIEGARASAEQALANAECIVGTQTASTNAWTGRASFPSLQDGQVIMYWLPYAGTSTAATLNLTMSGGGTTGAKNVYINAATRCTTHIAAGNMVQMVYRVNVTIGTGTYTGWWISRTLNDNTYDRIRFNNVIKAKTAISASRVIVGDSGGYFHLVAGSIFDVDEPILWAGSAITAAATDTNNYLSFPGCTLRNNTTSTWTATQYQTLYIAGSLVGNSFVVASENWLTTSPEVDTLTYLALGYMYSTYQMYLYPEHPMYRLVEGELTAISQLAYEAQVAASTAQATADVARAEFRRVVRIQDDGLHVGDNQSTGEVLIDSESVNIVMNGSKYSRFAANYVQFGNYQLRRTADGGLAFKITDI